MYCNIYWDKGAVEDGNKYSNPADFLFIGDAYHTPEGAAEARTKSGSALIWIKTIEIGEVPEV